jgi:hypothetical protein
MDASPTTSKVAYMQQLFLFIVQLGLIAWLRTFVVTRPRSDRVARWCVELGFGLLVALPLLSA